MPPRRLRRRRARPLGARSEPGWRSGVAVTLGHYVPANVNAAQKMRGSKAGSLRSSCIADESCRRRFAVRLPVSDKAVNNAVRGFSVDKPEGAEYAGGASSKTCIGQAECLPREPLPNFATAARRKEHQAGVKGDSEKISHSQISVRKGDSAR